ncbi:hypothetical protein LTR53_017638 [Teratosphaeriaceae sp. CCFEE 6253]|nr:hypothetical protein LTR53_017638 [Teratosphaeriaceae sp. CCFEE 6253]
MPDTADTDIMSRCVRSPRRTDGPAKSPRDLYLTQDAVSTCLMQTLGDRYAENRGRMDGYLHNALDATTKFFQFISTSVLWRDAGAA